MFSNLQDLIEADTPEYRYRKGRAEDALPKNVPKNVERNAETDAPVSSIKVQSTNEEDATSSAVALTVTLAPESVELKTWSGAPDTYKLSPSTCPSPVT